MSGCEGCYIGAKGQSQRLEQIRKEAKAYAVENNISVGIYKEAFEYFYGDAAALIAAGKPVMEVISGHN